MINFPPKAKLMMIEYPNTNWNTKEKIETKNKYRINYVERHPQIFETKVERKEQNFNDPGDGIKNNRN